MHWPTFVYAISTDVHLRDTQDLSMLRGNRDPSTLFKIARHYVPYFFFFFFFYQSVHLENTRQRPHSRLATVGEQVTPTVATRDLEQTSKKWHHRENAITQHSSIFTTATRSRSMTGQTETPPCRGYQNHFGAKGSSRETIQCTP